MSLKKIPKDDVKEMSFIELTFAILDEKKKPVSFNDLVDDIASHLELKKEKFVPVWFSFIQTLMWTADSSLLAKIAGDYVHGIHVDQQEEETVPTIKPRKKKAKKADVEDLELEELEEEEFEYDELDDFEEEDLVEDDDDDDDEDDDATSTISMRKKKLTKISSKKMMSLI